MKGTHRTFRALRRPVVPRVGTWVESCLRKGMRVNYQVVPRVGTWVERIWMRSLERIRRVVPRVGTWVESLATCACVLPDWSSPAWGRGLKVAEMRSLMKERGRPPRGDVG